MDSDGKLVISVRDTSIGIAADDIAAAMAPFGQVQANLARRSRGTGLGLPMVKALIELHGGVLTLASTPAREPRSLCAFPRT